MLYHIVLEDIHTKKIIKEADLNELNKDSILSLLENSLVSKYNVSLEEKAIYIFERYFKYDRMKTVIQAYVDQQIRFINFKIEEKGDL